MSFWFYRLPIPVQDITLFVGIFLLLFVGLFICRIVGIKSYGSEREYLRENNDPLTYKKIWAISLLPSIIITLFLALRRAGLL